MHMVKRIAWGLAVALLASLGASLVFAVFNERESFRGGVGTFFLVCAWLIYQAGAMRRE